MKSNNLKVFDSMENKPIPSAMNPSFHFRDSRNIGGYKNGREVKKYRGINNKNLLRNFRQNTQASNVMCW